MTLKSLKELVLKNFLKWKMIFFDFIITSPPYCNRYDYTRTYALELVYLGCDSEKIRSLRQELLILYCREQREIRIFKPTLCLYGQNDQLLIMCLVYTILLSQ